MISLSILPVAAHFQPDRQNFRCPPHGEDWGVEQDFLAWLSSPQAGQHGVRLTNPREADWIYLPIFWNRYYINNDWGQQGAGELYSFVKSCLNPSAFGEGSRIFTVCEYDLRQMYPQWDLSRMTIATASRRGDSDDIDVPLLCSPHALPPDRPPAKRWLASFKGNLGTWAVRQEMAIALGNHPGIRLEAVSYRDGVTPDPEAFVRLMRESYLALAPRGHGGQSFRFYEAMQLGVVPLHLGLPDTRPFRRWLHWEHFSLFRPTCHELLPWVLGLNPATLLTMGQLAAEVWQAELRYGRWCRYLIRELEVRL